MQQSNQNEAMRRFWEVYKRTPEEEIYAEFFTAWSGGLSLSAMECCYTNPLKIQEIKSGHKPVADVEKLKSAYVFYVYRFSGTDEEVVFRIHYGFKYALTRLNRIVREANLTWVGTF